MPLSNGGPDWRTYQVAPSITQAPVYQDEPSLLRGVGDVAEAGIRRSTLHSTALPRGTNISTSAWHVPSW